MATAIDRDEYVIRTRFEIDPRAPIAGIGAVSRRVRGVETLTRSVGLGIGSTLSRAFLLAGGTAGVGFLARGMIGLQTEIEDATTGIGSLLSASTTLGIADSIKVARAQVNLLRQDAAAGAGELRDFAEGFQLILGPSLSAGGSIEQIRELNRLALAGGFALRGQEGLRLAPLDVVQALTQGVGERTTPIVNQLLRAIGLTNQEFNKLSKPDRFEKLIEAFGTMTDGAEVMGQTWNAQMATLRDNVKELIRTVTRPLFDRWSQQLRDANVWFKANADSLNMMATDAGPKLVGIYDTLISRADTLATATATGAVGLSATRVGGLALGAAGTGGTGILGAIVAGVMLPLGIAFLALRSAIGESPELVDRLGVAVGFATEAVGGMFDSLLRLVGLPGIQDILTVAGEGLLKSATVLVVTIEVLARGIGLAAEFLGSVTSSLFTDFQSLQALLRGDTGTARAFSTAAGAERRVATDLLVQGFGDLFSGRRRRGRLFAAGTPSGADEEGLPEVVSRVTNIGTVNVTISTERLDDPNRVASSFDMVLKRLREFPTQAAGLRMVPKPQ